ncbi:Bulb-type lectin domain protein, partial [Nannochloropsis gaditana]
SSSSSSSSASHPAAADSKLLSLPPPTPADITPKVETALLAATAAGALEPIHEDTKAEEASSPSSAPSSASPSSPSSWGKIPFPSLPLHLLTLPIFFCAFLLGLFLLSALSSQSIILKEGDVLRPGDSLRYRCSFSDYFPAPSPSSSTPSSSPACHDLDLVLGKDGVLSLYRDRMREKRALMWQSEGGKEGGSEGGYVATVDERARLVVMREEGDVVWSSPRLLSKGGKEGREEGRAAAVLDGVMGGMYVMDGAGQPTFATIW